MAKDDGHLVTHQMDNTMFFAGVSVVNFANWENHILNALSVDHL